MRRVSDFEAQDGSLFLFERHNIRVINDHGEEAEVPLKDCLIFLSHLALYSEALDVSPAVSDWLKQLKASPPRPAIGLVSPPPPIAAGDSLLLFEGDSLLVLGAKTSETRISLVTLAALLDHLAASLPHPLAIPFGLRLAVTNESLRSDIPLLAPSEWLVFRAAREVTPITAPEIALRCPSLPLQTIEALAVRLTSRQLLIPSGSGWIAESFEPAALLQRMLTHWIAANALDNPEDLETLRGFLEK